MRRFRLDGRLEMTGDGLALVSLPEGATDLDRERLDAWVAAWRRIPDELRADEPPPGLDYSAAIFESASREFAIAEKAAVERVNALIDERLRDPVTIEALTTALIRRAARERLVSTGQ